ncbi:hypothetical protein A9Q93_12965 [Nonlabens dokdonensis]|uniref:Uncharacterized protein n=1 Tax=Nonlabens dokdonensis TaxID=328515 RepID=A0A1Z8AJD5_9FLAO|nr:hypothetical protein [Nonlabens dokdonensis]OUS10459.1 hypothetical protein A9Q93_12965 [Nonlabens dokdonensis]
MNKSYSELLKSPEWRSKRKEIIRRDKNSCQRCGIQKNSDMKTVNIKYPENLPLSTRFNFLQVEGINNSVVEIEYRKLKFLCKTDLNEITSNIKYAVFVNKRKIRKNKSLFQGSTLNNTKPNIFHSEENDQRLKNTLAKLLTKNNGLEIDPEGIWFGKYEEENNYKKKLNSLEVHHKCYRKGIDIWNQPDEDYVSLCNICHIIVHETTDIPFYDINGIDYRLRRICSKCHGKGKIKQFSHVENGKCFKCNGISFNV